MTIKKRLAISNVLMILVPVAITLLIAAGCVGVIWFQIAHGTGLGFEDSESFYQACTGISDLAAEALKSPHRGEQIESLKTLSSFLDRGAMSLVVTADGEEIYRYGQTQNAQLEAAALALDAEGTVSSGSDSLHIRPQRVHGVSYQIFLYGAQRELSYSNLKTAVILAGSVLLLAILLSVIFTDRFLTRFVVRHALCVRQADRQDKMLLAHDHCGICPGCAGGSRAGAGRRARMDSGLRPAGHPAHGQGH